MVLYINFSPLHGHTYVIDWYMLRYILLQWVCQKYTFLFPVYLASNSIFFVEQWCLENQSAVTYWKQCAIAKIYGFILLHIHTAEKNKLKKIRSKHLLWFHTVCQSSAATNIEFIVLLRRNMLWNVALINSGKPGQWHILFGERGDKYLRFGWAAMRVKQTSSSVV